MSGLVSKIKQDVKESGGNKKKFVYLKDGDKRRFRFLTPLDDGLELTFHDSFQQSINVPCQEVFGRTCEYCEQEGLRTRSLYAWSVWDYDAAEVKIFLYAVNQCTPVPGLIALYDVHGSITDRDVMISVSGKQQSKTFSVIGMDKNPFRNKKAKPLSKKAILGYLDKAFPSDSSSSASTSTEEENDLDMMTAKELYMLCVEKGIECEKRQPKDFYKELLMDWEDDEDDWGDDDDEDDWDD